MRNIMLSASVVTVLAAAVIGGAGFLNSGYSTVQTPIQWKSYDEGMALAKSQNKPVYIQFFATWCGYCKKMDQEVFTSARLQNQLMNDFVAIRVTESSDNKVQYEGKEITEKELTLAYQVNGFPTNLFIGKDGEPIGKLAGFIPLENMQSLLEFIHSDSYKSMKYQDYLKSKKG